MPRFLSHLLQASSRKSKKSQDMDGPNLRVYQETSRKINEYKSGIPAHETTGAEINQK